MTITSPGHARKIITVASLTDNGTGSNYTDDYVSTYSSGGPTLIDHVLKPDLIAAGNRYVAAIPSESRLKAAHPERQYNCGSNCTSTYMEMSGTSMAAGHVSGAVLLMLPKQSTLSPSTVKARLMRSARKIAGSDPTATGAGVLNVTGALADTGVLTGQALSPRMQRSDQGSATMVENTATLWNDTAFGAGCLWQNGYLWSNGYLWNNGYLWEDAADGTDDVSSAGAASYGVLPD
jgi:serine protease AprX